MATPAPVTATSAPVPTAPVTAAPVTAAPVMGTAAPVMGTAAPVTAAPVTTVPSSSPSVTPFDKLIEQTLTTVALQGGVEFADPTSYQSKALAWLQQDPLSASINTTQLVQRYALGCVYYATNAVQTPYTDADFGTGVVMPWFNETGWLSSNSECTWYGIICDTNDDVISINLVSMRECSDDGAVQTVLLLCLPFSVFVCVCVCVCVRFHPTHSDEHMLFCSSNVISLPTLVRSHMNEQRENQVTGSFPEEVTLLSSTLRQLDLTFNLVNNIGPAGNAWLGDLSNLEGLYVGSTNFDSIGPPTELGKLTSLGMSGR